MARDITPTGNWEYVGVAIVLLIFVYLGWVFTTPGVTVSADSLAELLQLAGDLLKGIADPGGAI